MLWNTGEDAYQHEVFGDWLTIERILKVAGTASEYRLYNSANKLVSVCDHGGCICCKHAPGL
jgi:hypothetical protein